MPAEDRPAPTSPPRGLPVVAGAFRAREWTGEIDVATRAESQDHDAPVFRRRSNQPATGPDERRAAPAFPAEPLVETVLADTAPSANRVVSRVASSRIASEPKPLRCRAGTVATASTYPARSFRPFATSVLATRAACATSRSSS